MLGQEIIRLVRLSREFSGEELLTEALARRERTIDKVVKLFGFITKNIDQDSTVAEKFWRPVEVVLEESDVTPQARKKIRYPSPRSGEPGFRSIFDEMLEEGLISKEDYAAIHNRSLWTL